MTAAGLDYVSDGRFRLGIGTSGPQVMEGFHGVPFDAPLGRTREVVEICRQVWRRENVEFDGKHYQLPLPHDRGTGLGKPLHLINHPVRWRRYRCRRRRRNRIGRCTSSTTRLVGALIYRIGRELIGLDDFVCLCVRFVVDVVAGRRCRHRRAPRRSGSSPRQARRPTPGDRAARRQDDSADRRRRRRTENRDRQVPRRRRAGPHRVRRVTASRAWTACRTWALPRAARRSALPASTERAGSGAAANAGGAAIGPAAGAAEVPATASPQARCPPGRRRSAA